MLSEHNQFQFVLSPPPRGLILDRNGVVLASNRPDFRLLLNQIDGATHWWILQGPDPAYSLTLFRPKEGADRLNEENV